MKHKVDIPVPAEVAALMAGELEGLADAERAESAQRYFKGAVQALGIDAATMRSCAKSWAARLKPVWSLKEAEALCAGMLAKEPCEMRALGFLVLGEFKKTFDRELFFRVEPWILSRLDNWALVDGFASLVLTPLLEKHPDLDAELPRWGRSECLWMRRSALVCLVSFARKGKRLDLVYQRVTASLGAGEDLMHKAMGWLLREAGKTDAERLKAFLLAQGATTPRTTLRYAIERFPVEERKSLLERTRRG